MTEIDSSSGSITFGGLSSNLDTNKIIAAMVEAQRRPMAKIEQQQATLDAHSGLVQGIGSRVGALLDVARSMESLARLLPQQATSSDPTVVRASAGEGATEGMHQVAVTKLAQAERALSAPIKSGVEAGLVRPGRIAWQVQGEPCSIEVTADMNLQDVATALSRTRKGLSASVLFDGTSYRLSVRASAVGAANGLALEDSTNLGLGRPEGQLVRACDAEFIIDGQIAMSRPSNTVADAIEGVTLRLEAEGKAQAIHVMADAAHMFSKIEDFVAAYNEVRDAVDLATRPSRDYERARMVGDSTLRNLMDALQRTVTAPVEGVAAQTQSLAAIGIVSDKEGKLHLDSAKVANAIAEQPEDVARLFGRDHRSGSRGVAVVTARVCDQYSSPMTGTLTLKVASMARQKTAADGRLAQMQTNLERFESTTRRKFTELERTMTIMKSQNEKLQQQIKSLQKKD